jgi:hypothetical protein
MIVMIPTFNPRKVLGLPNYFLYIVHKGPRVYVCFDYAIPQS